MKTLWSKKRLVAIILSLLIAFGCFSTVAFAETGWDGTTATAPAGSGTETEPYQIASPENLAWISLNLGDTSFAGCFFELTADIDLNGKAWKAIPQFNGVFNGNKHTISNFTASEDASVGLFGRLVDAGVCNVKFSKVTVTTPTNSSGFGGVLAGYAENCIISGITVASDCSVTGYNVGGIIGRTWSKLSTVSYCVNDATVTTHGSVGGEAAGGIVGLACLVNISYCKNNGTISSGTPASGEQLVGGIAGRFGRGSATTATYCVNTGAVSGSHTVGGILGKTMQAGCSVEHCVSTVAVTAGNEEYSGSLVGRFNVATTASDCFLIISDTYGITGSNAGEAAKGTLTNVKACDNTEDEGMIALLAEIDTAFQTYEKNSHLIDNVPTPPEKPTEPKLPDPWAPEDVATQFESGSGTYDDPYMIKTAGQFALLAQNVNNGTTYEKTYFALANNIDLGGKNWIPVAIDANHSFEGIFNGKGYTVSNFTILTTDDSTVVHAGLFGKIVNATVKNVSIDNAEIYIHGTSSFAAGIVGMASASTVTGCKVGENVRISYVGTQNTENCTVGGIVGVALDESTVSYCQNSGTVYGERPKAPAFAGGIVGLLGKATVSFCSNDGPVTVATTGGWFDAGGIVGRMGNKGQAGAIVNCMNTGLITSSQHAGGIVGVVNCALNEIRNCYTTSAVYGNLNWSGLGIGRWSDYYLIIENCYFVNPNITGESNGSLGWISRGMGTFDEEFNAGSKGMTTGDFEEKTMDEIALLTAALSEEIANGITASIAVEEKEPAVIPEDDDNPPDEKPTQPAETTGAATSEPVTSGIPTEPLKSGCSSTVSCGILVTALLVGGVLAVRKKKEE